MGIVIQSLRPFYVNTKMTRYSKTLTSHSFLVPSAEEYARQAVATLGHSGRTTGYWPHTLQVQNFQLRYYMLCYPHRLTQCPHNYFLKEHSCYIKFLLLAHRYSHTTIVEGALINKRIHHFIGQSRPH